MGKVANGDGGNLPYESKGTSYPRHIERRFAFTAHPCDTGGRCRILGCDRSYTWKEAQVPPLVCVDTLLYQWNAYRSPDGRPSKLALSRRNPGLGAATKQQSLNCGFNEIACLVYPLRNLTILCDWAPAKISRVFDEVMWLVGSTMLGTKALHFLLPDLFVILDRGQSYPPLRRELNAARRTKVLPRTDLIDLVSGENYTQLMSYVRDEITTLIAHERSVCLKDGTKKEIKTVNDFRWLSPRNGGNGRAMPGTICKVVDDFFPAPKK